MGKKIQMKKAKKMSSILTIYSMVALIVLNIITALLMGTISKYLVGEKEKSYLIQIQANAQKQIEDFVEKYTMTTQVLAGNTELKDALGAEEVFSQTPDFSKIIGMMATAQNQYKEVLNIGIGSVKENAIYMSNGKKADVALNSRPFYEAVVQNQTFITPPYIDTVTGNMCVSIAVPVQKDGKAVGVVCLDLNLGMISELLTSLSFEETGRLLLMGSDQTVIGYADESMVGLKISDVGLNPTQFENALKAGSNVPFTYDLKGDTKVGMLSELPSLDWYLLIGLSEKEYYKDSVQMQAVLWTLLLLDVVLSGLWLYRIISKRLRPVSKINAGLLEISNGNLKIEELKHNTDDEIGEMADSMAMCVKNLSLYISEIDKMMESFAKGDLTYRSKVEFHGDFRSIQDSVERFREKLEQLMVNILDSSDQVSSGSEQVAAGAQSLAQGATEQASSVEELAASIADVSQQVTANAENAQLASEKSILASEALDKCQEQMNCMNSAMQEINSTSEKISHIIKTIEDIAFQTNILALNASIEAARSGAAGKGFAVVASEVGTLSYKSADASKEITQLIESSLKSVKDGATAVESTMEAMSNVMQHAQGVTEMVNKISQASTEQASAISQINLGVSQISNVVQITSATAEESAAASEELSGLAGILKKSVNQFKLK